MKPFYFKKYREFTSQGNKESTSAVLGNGGFTIVEILVALAIMALVTAAVFQLYISQYKTWVSQDLITEMQQNARVTVDAMSRDILMAGYGVTTAIEDGNASRIAIRYKDFSDASIKRIAFWKGDDNVLYRKEDTSPTGKEVDLPGLSYTNGSPLTDNVTALQVTYFKDDGTLLASYNGAYRIKVSVTVQESKADPITGTRKTLTLSTDIRPRNIGIGTVAADTESPEVPNRPSVTDPHICGKLYVSWSPAANAGGDLWGYVLYVGVAPGTYTQRISVGNVTSYSLTGLDDRAKYYIAVTSRDTSSNESSYSQEAFTGDGTSNDTTPDADEPGQPVGLDATASTSGAPSVTLSWTLNSTTYPTATTPLGALHTAEASPAPGATAGPGYGPDSDVGKYEVERKLSTDPDTSFNKIGESTTSTYTDSSLSEVNKCTVYAYRIRAVNSCNDDKKSPYSSTASGDGGRSATDTPTSGVTNTMPSDSTKPAAPTNAISKAGYRRTFMNWMNPGDGDLSYVVIRYNSQSGSIPPYPGVVSASPLTFNGTAVENGTAQGSFATSNIGTAYIGGSFAPNATMAFTHYGSVAETPSLLDGYTYSYSIFAVDTCGNVSNAATTAQTTVGQCGEETDVTNPTTGAPPKPTNFGISACEQYNFTWDRIDDSYPGGEYDLAGYYTYKRQDSAAWTPSAGSTGTKSSGLLLNPGSGQLSWSDLGTNPDTNSAYEGKSYQYYTIPIDCNREQNSDAAVRSNPWAAIASAPTPSPTASDVITVRPGLPTFRNSTTVTTRGNPWNSGWPYDYMHDNVSLRLDNTSAGTVLLKSMKVSWANTSAWLWSVYKKDGASHTWIGWGTGSSPATVYFWPFLEIRGVTDPLYQPFNLELIYGWVDMRDDALTIYDIEYEKTFERNGAMLYPSCTASQVEASKESQVPMGPVISGTAHNKTATDIVASSTSPGYWSVGASYDVNVFANVSDTSLAGIDSVKLYYKTSSKSVWSVWDLPGYGDISTWTELPMTNLGGTQYALYNPTTGTGNKIPASSDQRVWYLVIATDKKGNLDMDPDWNNWTVYTYDHKSLDPCSVTPSNPTVLLGDASALTSVNLSWTAPTTYTNGESKYSSDTFKYRVYRKTDSGSFIQVPSGGCSGNIAGISCTDNQAGLDANARKYSYYVKAINSCVDTAPTCDASSPSCLSSESNTYAECVGAEGKSVTVDKASMYGGESFTITVYLCEKNGNAASDSITVRVNDSGEPDFRDDYTISETGDTGTFTSTRATTRDAGANTSAILLVNATDTITVDPNNEFGGPKTISVTTNPCSDTPAAPTNLRASAAPGCSSDRSMTLAWDANSETDVIGYDVYQIEPTGTTTPVCSTNSRVATSCTADTSDNGKLNSKLYQWVVKAKDSCSTPNVSPNSNTYSDPCS